jgi:hypothetical protein
VPKKTSSSGITTSYTSSSSKLSWSFYSNFKFNAENEAILNSTFSRLSPPSSSANSIQKLRSCLASKDPQIYMNGVAVAGLSIEKGLGLKEIISLLGDGDAWVVANVCEALINSTGTIKQSPNGSTANEFAKVTASVWSEIGQHFASLPSDCDQRMNILKFFANSLSQTTIISNFLKSSALGSLSAKIWQTDTNGRFLGADEERHALLVVLNNLIVSSKATDWKGMCEDARIISSLAKILGDIANPDRVAIAVQIVNSICQESSYVKYFVGKDKPFGQALIQLLKAGKLDPNIQLRLVRLCGSLMQDYEGLKQLTNGGVFKFYATCLSSASNDEIVMAILATLANLALSDHLTPNLPQLMEESKVLNALQDLLTKPQTKPETRIRAGIAISNLMTVETLQAPFASTGGIKTLLDTANKTNQAQSEQDAEVFQKSLSALFHLSLYYDSMRVTMVQEGLLKSLGGMISASPPKGGSISSKVQVDAMEKAKTAAMKTLYNVSMTDGTEVEFVKQNVVTPLISILKANMSIKEEDQNISAAILENLAQNALFQDHLLSTGGVDAVLSLVSEGSNKVQERAARLVARLAVNNNVRKHLQTKNAAASLAKAKSSSSLATKSAIEAALHNVSIPVEDDKFTSGTASIQDDEDPLLAKMASEFDLDDDGSIIALDRLLNESSPSSLSLNVVSSNNSVSSSPRIAAKTTQAVRSPPPHIPSKPTSPRVGDGSQQQQQGGPPPVPPKPPPKPSMKKVNVARRAIGSQPPRPAALAPKQAMMRPKMMSPLPTPKRTEAVDSTTTTSSSSASAADPEEAFEDRGLKKESYMLVGSDAANAQPTKKKRGLLTSLKNLFSSNDSVSPLVSSLHEGPWEVDESAISQKCPSLIYDYYNHWCESCKRDGSLCGETTDALRKLRMRLIRSREPKSFAPTKTRDRSNSDPIAATMSTSSIKQQTTNGGNSSVTFSATVSAAPIATPSTASSSMIIETPSYQGGTIPSSSPPRVNNFSSHEATSSSAPSSSNDSMQQQQNGGTSTVLSRPPPPQTNPPISSMPIPQNIVVSPRKPSVGANSARSQIISTVMASPTSQQQTVQTVQKMPAHPPQPSLADPLPKKTLPADADPEMVKKAKMHVKRTHIAQELLTTEGTYMQNLAIILKKFQAPLTSSLATPKPLISEADIKIIFGSIEIIYNVNLLLIERLNMKMRRWTSKQTLGEVFIYMADWLKIYTDYINNYDKSQSTLLRCKEDSPRFAQFLVDRTLDPVCALRGLETFLVTPVQRPPRYSLLLRELIKNTDESHPDWADLNKASVRIEEITMYLNEKRRDFDTRNKMFALAHSLTSSKIRAEIVQPHRENLLEAMVEFSFKSPSKTGSGRLYLLNDAFLLTKIVSKTRQKLVRIIPHVDIAATIPPFFTNNTGGGVNDDPHLRELTLLHLHNQEFILITFDAVEHRDQMYNHYLRLQPNLMKK